MDVQRSKEEETKGLSGIFFQTVGVHLQGRAEGQSLAASNLFPTRGGIAAPFCTSVGPPLKTCMLILSSLLHQFSNFSFGTKGEVLKHPIEFFLYKLYRV